MNPTRHAGAAVAAACAFFLAPSASADPPEPPAASSPLPPLGIRVDDRARFLEAKRLLDSGAASPAYDQAKPLFDAYPDNVRVQDLRCRIAAVRQLDKDTLYAECLPYAQLTPQGNGVPPDTRAVPPTGPSLPATPSPAATRAAKPASPPAEPPTASEPRLLTAYAGIGGSFATQSSYGSGTGFYGEGDYVIPVTAWIVPKAYAGLLLTSSNGSSCSSPGTSCNVSAQVVFGGGKIRLTAPIPYFAPFLDLGVGLALGLMTTTTSERDAGSTYITYQIPVSIGLALGKDKEVEMGLGLVFQPSAPQSDADFVLGLTFPLR